MIAGILFRQILSLFLIVACGYAIVRTGLLRAEESRVLSILSVYIIMPCVIIHSFQVTLTPDILHGFLMATVSALVIHGVLFLLNVFYRRVLRLRPVESASVIYSNAGNLIVPLITAILGEEWVIYASAFMCVQIPFMWSHGLSLVNGERRISVKKVLLNANMIAVFIGIFLLLTDIRLPEVVNVAMREISGTIGPISMLMIGMLIASVDARRLVTNPRIYLVALLRLLVSPLAVLAVLRCLGLHTLVANGTTILYISYIACITPSASTVTQQAQLCGREPEYAGAVNVMTTLLCIITMPVMTEIFSRLIR